MQIEIISCKQVKQLTSTADYSRKYNLPKCFKYPTLTTSCYVHLSFEKGKLWTSDGLTTVNKPILLRKSASHIKEGGTCQSYWYLNMLVSIVSLINCSNFHLYWRERFASIGWAVFGGPPKSFWRRAYLFLKFVEVETIALFKTYLREVSIRFTGVILRIHFHGSLCFSIIY